LAGGRNWCSPEMSARTVAVTVWASFHPTSTSTPLRARKPRAEPVFHAAGHDLRCFAAVLDQIADHPDQRLVALREIVRLRRPVIHLDIDVT
jgi:hypothetical protein